LFCNKLFQDTPVQDRHENFIKTDSYYSIMSIIVSRNAHFTPAAEIAELCYEEARLYVDSCEHTLIMKVS